MKMLNKPKKILAILAMVIMLLFTVAATTISAYGYAEGAETVEKQSIQTNAGERNNFRQLDVHFAWESSATMFFDFSLMIPTNLNQNQIMNLLLADTFDGYGIIGTRGFSQELFKITILCFQTGEVRAYCEYGYAAFGSAGGRFYFNGEALN